LKLLFLSYYILSNFSLFGQVYPFREYSSLDGLPQSQSTGVKQDSRGFIWICTRNGLSRFDGIEFKNYFRKDGLPSNLVLSITEDNEGIIWAMSHAGLSEYNGFGFDYFPMGSEFDGWEIQFGSAVDKENNIYLLGMEPYSSKRRIIVFNKGVYSNYSKKYPQLDTLEVESFFFSPSKNQMLLVDKNKNMWTWKDRVLSLTFKKKFDFIFYEGGNLLGSSDNTVYIYKNNGFEVFEQKPVPGKPGVKYSASGINPVMDYYDGRFYNKLFLPFNPIGCIVDKKGVLWFSSEKNLYRLVSTAFRSFSETDINARNIWAIAEDRDGHIWFGSLYDKLIEFDGKNFIERNEYKKLFTREVGFFKGSRKMSNGDVWFSTYLGVIIWNGDKFSRLQGIPEDTQICYTYEDPVDKSVMLGTEKGLYHLKNGKINYFPEFNDNAGLGVIEGATRDNTGGYLLSGHKGLVRFDGIHSVPVKEGILPEGYTYTIEKDKFGGIWVSSEEGLYFRRKDNEAFIYGLPEAINVSANTVFLTDSMHLLVGRISDICLIDLEKFYNDDPDYYTLLDKTDGFMGADCLDNGIIKDQQGRIWILTSTDVVVFEPEKIVRNTTPPVLHLNGFDYETDSLSWEPVEKSQFFYGEPDNIKLERLKNSIRISFTGISTDNPEKVKYSHRLVGYNDKWSLPAAQRYVEFDNLPPGSYSFQVVGSNAAGVGNTEPLTINFRILPSFWETGVFYIIAIFLLIIVTVIVTFLIMRRINRERAEQQRINSELFRLQMNSVIKQFEPHFTFNVISSVGSLIMMGEKEIAYDYIVKFSSLLRTVLNEGTLIIKSLSEELDFVTRYCELQKLRFKERFSYCINVRGNVDLQREIPKMTIQTFVENAIRHGLEPRKEGGQVVVKISNGVSGIEIVVRDNGIGRAAAMKQNTMGTGHGLKIIEGIFKTINENNITKSKIIIKDLTSETGIADGTEVKIFIPDNYRFEFTNRRIKK
jgi:ligand-binding sensor domain-containing protein